MASKRLSSKGSRRRCAAGVPTKGSPAEEADLADTSKNPGLWIDAVDGSNFGWDVNALIYHITSSPAISVQTTFHQMAYFRRGYVSKTYQVHNRKADAVPDPADGELAPFPATDEVKAWLAQPSPWVDLLKLRSRTDVGSPLSIDLAGSKAWVVLANGEPNQDNPPKPL